MISWQKKKEEEKQRIIENMAFPWDQNPGEPDKEFRLFLRYLSLGKTRNYTKVAKTSSVAYSAVNIYSIKYQWKKRAMEYDLAKEEEFKIKLDEEIIQSRIRQQRLGSEMQNLANKGLKILNKDIEGLSAQDIVKLCDIGVKIERLALGSSTEIKESTVKAEIDAKIKVEEIPKEIAEKIGKELAIKSSKDVDK